MPKYTIRSSRREADGFTGAEETATTDSIQLAVLLCQALEKCRWWQVELEDERHTVLWATYIQYDPTAFPGKFSDLRDIPAYRQAAD